MDRKSICKHRFLAAMLAVFLCFSLLVTGICLSLKLGAFGAGSIKDFLEQAKVMESLSDVVDDVVEKEIGNDELGWILESDNYDVIKDEMIDITMDIVLGSKEVDLSKLVDLLIDSVEDGSDKLVDEVMVEIENIGEDFDARENDYVQNIIDTYSLEVDDNFYDKLNEYAQYADNIDEYTDEIKEEIDTQIIEPVKEQAEDISKDMEKELDEKLQSYYDSEGYEVIELANEAMNVVAVSSVVAIGIGATVSVVFALIICLLYKRGIYGAFSKFAGSFGFAGVFILIIGAIKLLADFIIETALEDLSRQYSARAVAAMDDVMVKVVDSIFNPFIVIGAIYMVAMIVFIVLKVIARRNWNVSNNG